MEKNRADSSNTGWVKDTDLNPKPDPSAQSADSTHKEPAASRGTVSDPADTDATSPCPPSSKTSIDTQTDDDPPFNRPSTKAATGGASKSASSTSHLDTPAATPPPSDCVPADTVTKPTPHPVGEPEASPVKANPARAYSASSAVPGNGDPAIGAASTLGASADSRHDQIQHKGMTPIGSSAKNDPQSDRPSDQADQTAKNSSTDSTSSAGKPKTPTATPSAAPDTSADAATKSTPNPVGQRDTNIQESAPAKIKQPPSTVAVDPSAASAKPATQSDLETAPTGEIVSAPAVSEPAPRLNFDDIASVRDLLTVLADGKPTPKITLPADSPVRAALTRDTTPLADLNEEIGRLTEVDTHLEIALSLISATEKLRLTGRLSGTLRQLSALLLSRHPAFRPLGMENELKPLAWAETRGNVAAPRSDTARLLRNITQHVTTFSPEDSTIKTWKITDRQKLQRNSMLTLILLSASREQWSNLEYIRLLASYVWADAAKPASLSPANLGIDRTSLLVAKSAQPALTIVAAEFSGELARRDSAIAAAQEETARARAETAAARTEIKAAHNQRLSADERIAALEATVAETRDELALERSARRSERTGAVNKIETLREAVTPIISRQISVLDDALDALRRDLTSVTDQYLDRSIAELQRAQNILYPDDTALNEEQTK